MIRFAVLTGAALALSLSASAEDLAFDIINLTSYDIVEFQVSDPSDDYWSDNLMPRGYVLPSGNYTTVYIGDGEDFCEYDIKAVFDDGDEIVEYDSNLCDLGEWTFTD